MAVAYGSSNTSTYGTTNSPVVTKPTGLAVGDLMIAFAGGNSSGIISGPFPSGFTEIGRQEQIGLACAWGYKIADSADVAATNFTFATDGVISVADLIRVTGGTPTGIQSSGVQATGTNSCTATNTITPAANSLLLFFALAEQDSNATRSCGSYAIATNNPTWTEIIDTSTTSDDDGGHGVAYANRPQSTATGNSTWAWSGSGYSNNIGVMLSIPPASGPTNVKTFDGVASASIKTYLGTAVANVKTVNGIA